MKTLNGKLAVFGGSFDPIHTGHLLMAQDVVETLDLETLVFMPAAQNPHKTEIPRVSDRHRLEMLKLAIAGKPEFAICDHEVKAGGISYTIETVSWLKREYGKDSLYWIIGADQLTGLQDWHRIDELVGMLEFICLKRPGFAIEKSKCIDGLRLHVIEGRMIEISSTEIRNRICDNKPVDLFVPEAVCNYLNKHQLYR